MPFDREKIQTAFTTGVNVVLRRALAWTTKYKTALTILVVVLFMYTSYWAFIGFSLDNSIRTHIAECETKIADPEKHKCVVAFIPIPR